MEFVLPLDPATLLPVDEPYRDRSDGVKGHAVQAAAISDPMKEIVHVIDYFLGNGSEGSGQNEGDLQQLRKAIQQAVGGDSVLQNNLAFPEVETADGRLTITDNANGTLTIDAAQTWLWRGLFRISSDDFLSALRTVTTVASKTYHLRWHAPGTGTAIPLETYPNGRFELADLTGASPAEDDAGYDTTYDQMLIARIVTDGANAATVTALSNMAALIALITGAARSYSGAAASDPNYPFTFNWARLPRYSLGALLPPSNSYDSDYYIYPSVLNRYGATIYSWSWHHGYPNQSPGFHINLEA